MALLSVFLLVAIWVRFNEARMSGDLPFEYPKPICAKKYLKDGDDSPLFVSMENAPKLLQRLFAAAGVVLKLPPSICETSVDFPVPSGSEELDLPAIITPDSQHIPGGTMKLVGLMRVPTRSGWKQLSANEVNGFFHDGSVPLSALMPESALKKLYYQELDVLRFCFVAVSQAIDRECFGSDGELTPLARRDFKSNCRNVESEEESGRTLNDDSKPKRFLKPLLLEECSKLWPYIPAEKAAQLTVVSDPTQPRHKPLFQATLELTQTKKRTVFQGSWQKNKRDAENDVCGTALTFLHSQRF